MILPTMTVGELAKEILCDYALVVRKAEYLVASLRRHAVKSKDKYVTKTFDFISGRKNNWFVIVDYYVKDPSFVVCVHYVDRHGFNGIMVHPNKFEMSHYSSHFLERYNERFLKTPDMKKLAILKRFLHRNSLGTVKQLPGNEHYSNPFFGRYKEGVGLGYCESLPNAFIFRLRTFISGEMIFDSQQFTLNCLSEKYRQFWDEGYAKRKIGAFE